MMIINPGSDVVGGKVEDAIKEAERLLQCIKDDGITGVGLLREYKKTEDGRYIFKYRHEITGRVGEWCVTGLEDNWRGRGFMFQPRIYWNGSSCSSPEWKDFLTGEYEITVRKKDSHND